MVFFLQLGRDDNERHEWKAKMESHEGEDPNVEFSTLEECLVIQRACVE